MLELSFVDVVAQETRAVHGILFCLQTEELVYDCVFYMHGISIYVYIFLSVGNCLSKLFVDMYFAMSLYVCVSYIACFSYTAKVACTICTSLFANVGSGFSYTFHKYEVLVDIYIYMYVYIHAERYCHIVAFLYPPMWLEPFVS